MAINYPGFGPIPRADLSGIGDIVENMAKGYQAGRMPDTMREEQEGRMRDNAMKAIQQAFMPQEKEAHLGLLAAQTAKAKEPAQLSYMGPAREAMDLERLKEQTGENSPVYLNALKSFLGKQQAQEDLSGIRGRQLTGLKPGERWMSDESGQPVGKETPLSATERAEARGRGYFNYAFDNISRGLAPLSGTGSYRKFADAAANYATDDKAAQVIDDYLLGKKLLTSGVVKEAATLGSGKQKATYQQLRESLESSDIPKSIDKLVKQFGLPASAAIKADERFKAALNAATRAGEQSIPAFNKQYFKPGGYTQTPKDREDERVGEDIHLGKTINTPSWVVDASTYRQWLDTLPQDQQQALKQSLGR